MASTYSPLKVELIGTGDQSGTWGDTTNVNFNIAFQEAITGSADVAFSSADVTLTWTDTNGTQTARNLRLKLTGTSGGARNLIVPIMTDSSGNIKTKQYIIYNTLADAVTVKTPAGTGVVVPAGKSKIVFNDGTNVVEALTLTSGTSLLYGDGNGGFSNVTIGTGLSFSTGTLAGTGLTTYPGAGIATSTGSAWGSSLTAPSGTIVGTTDTQTLTNKRVTPRVLASTANSATPTINTDLYDFVDITAQSVAITSFTTNLSGTPTNGQKLQIAITGTASIALTWGASFESSTASLPTTTSGTNRLDVGFIWNSATSKWRCLASG